MKVKFQSEMKKFKFRNSTGNLKNLENAEDLTITERDHYGNIVYERLPNGYEYRYIYEYGENGKILYKKTDAGYFCFF